MSYLCGVWVVYRAQPPGRRADRRARGPGEARCDRGPSRRLTSCDQGDPAGDARRSAPSRRYLEVRDCLFVPGSLAPGRRPPAAYVWVVPPTREPNYAVPRAQGLPASAPTPCREPETDASQPARPSPKLRC
ncbi:hypothetical protein AAFF_G00125270 [Aldrovandia affinis]|uniref:Uncharacterized protein n=1 Tax=Aldrovandia affinis TaxID=143900 RepID=A0AAD7RRB7_9TELE|nr:hypothetical protein AAFF_G00125270 [Aldrovandia affinis]